MPELLASHPFFVAIVSMTAAALGYVPLFGWRLALSLISVLLVHELGHVAAACLLRLTVRMLVFVPFLGAFVLLKDSPRIVEHDAVFALGGPVAGALFAFACAIAAVSTGNTDMAELGGLGSIVNMLNLMPLPLLDGSRVLAVVSPRLGVPGLPILGTLIWWQASYDFVILALVAVPFVLHAIRGDEGDRETIAFYAAPPRRQIGAVAAYAATAGLLILSLASSMAVK